ncbi:ogr/Delta-like zinc finger family protein [Spongiibacter taiwanensis]|uniref:ogr/Delta-like zinc finger family protein n=1 Tax=Spongiibacter taiwanensis TaxID=1748242 RepID=UPI0020361665|nr:ogr/Delta-like zinc finger family protein [Spongiibacter taiwanensis]USA43351.1 ogr/Delta-like zinc finger family protein [Spongiibacter taiwanensis]
MSRLVPCPHCLCDSYIRDSEQMTRLTRELTLICKNPVCGHTWVAHLTATRTLSESATPHPSVHLPVTKGLFSKN